MDKTIFTENILDTLFLPMFQNINQLERTSYSFNDFKRRKMAYLPLRNSSALLNKTTSKHHGTMTFIAWIAFIATEKRQILIT